MKVIRKVQAIIYDIRNDRPYFLILHRTLNWKGWESLKETIEKGETQKQALIRGVKEETHLKKFEIIKRLNKKIRWKSKGRNYEIVNVYLIKANMSSKISIKQEIDEHDKHIWVTKEKAVKLLTYKNAKDLIKNTRVW